MVCRLVRRTGRLSVRPADLLFLDFQPAVRNISDVYFPVRYQIEGNDAQFSVDIVFIYFSDAFRSSVHLLLQL